MRDLSGIVLLAGLLFVACAAEPQPVRPQQVAKPPDAPSLGQLEGRSHTWIISAGPNGPRYSVKSMSGVLVVADLTKTELRQQHPKLHGVIDSAIAKESPFLDARVPAMPAFWD